MKIELKNIKYAAFASEETYCFSASIHIDGVLSGTVSNEGHGGAHRFYPFDLQRDIDAYAKTLPKVDLTSVGMPGHMMDQDAETLVNDLMADWLTAKDLKRSLSGRILAQRADGKIVETKKMPTDALSRLLANPATIAKHFPGMKVLNLMPFDEALQVYKACAQ